MEKMKNKSIAERLGKTSYRNFNVSVYCPVQNVNDITNLEEFDRKFRLLSDNVKIGRAYIECYRGMVWADKEQLLKVKKYFESKGDCHLRRLNHLCGRDQEGGVHLPVLLQA